jgi:hypothetical protein
MPSTRSKKNNKNNKSKKNFQQGGGGGFLGKLFRKKPSPNTKKKVPNPPPPPTARTNTITNPNPNTVPSKNISTSTAKTNNNPVPEKIQIEIKEQIATKINDLIQTLKDKNKIIIIRIPVGQYIYKTLKDFIDSGFMVLYEMSEYQYQLMYHSDKIKGDIIKKAQLIYDILDDKYKKQIIDNFNLIDFINICLKDKDNLSYYSQKFLQGLKDINEILTSILNSNDPDFKIILINVGFVEGLIYY